MPHGASHRQPTRRSSTNVRSGEGSQQIKQITGLLADLVAPSTSLEKLFGVPVNAGPGMLSVLEGPANSLSITASSLGRAIDEVLLGRSSRIAAANARRSSANISREISGVGDVAARVANDPPPGFMPPRDPETGRFPGQTIGSLQRSEEAQFTDELRRLINQRMSQTPGRGVTGDQVGDLPPTFGGRGAEGRTAQERLLRLMSRDFTKAEGRSLSSERSLMDELLEGESASGSLLSRLRNEANRDAATNLLNLLRTFDN